MGLDSGYIITSMTPLSLEYHSELIITFGHRSNDQEFTTRDRLLVSMNRQVWPDINALVEMSLSVVPQRWLNDRSRRQRLKMTRYGASDAIMATTM